jgi:hypothetical protein
LLGKGAYCAAFTTHSTGISVTKRVSQREMRTGRSGDVEKGKLA